MYMFVVIFYSLLFVKLLKLCLLALICLNIQLCDVFWASVNLLKSINICYMEFLLNFGVYLLKCIFGRICCILYVFWVFLFT